ncbi:hypothetical protein HN604_00830 [archaeon]|jgi:hypothetical protein|nr:hypothetical protein [archaeon]MBT6182341.1 hypothetical protein [archaeon]MBT6606687.1 hypothetical protein [archaeon]MBT7251930.1 hypothetical protein [archaeon]MBT7660609.1 hypothetical protein [archaeon]
MKGKSAKQKNLIKNLIIIAIIILLIVGFLSLLFFWSPEELVKKLGVQNAYLFLFFISFFGGFSAWGSVSFIATLITFATSGLNPLFVGITAGTSLFMGDLLMLYLGGKGIKALDKKWDNRLQKFSKKFSKKTMLLIPFITFFYIAFVPLPNDIMIAFIAIMHYPYKKAVVPIILGDYVFAILVAILASQGILLF